MNNSERHIDIEQLTRYFSGEIKAKEKEEVDAWIEIAEENREEFNRLQKLWAELGNTSPDRKLDVDKEWNYLQTRIQTGAPEAKRRIAPILRIAAAVIILIGSVYVALTYTGGKTIKTELAEITKIELPDGSVVTLNADSKFSYSKDFNETDRRVKLTGEGFFEVAKNASKPFVVEMDEAEVKVLGTSFNVRAYKDDRKIEVTVAEGKVSIYDKHLVEKKVVATEGEKAEFLRKERVVKASVNVDQNYNAWKTRKIVFEEESLGEISQTLSKVYHTPFKIKNSALINCTATVSFENKDLNTVLEVLESTLDITIEMENGEVQISGPGC